MVMRDEMRLSCSQLTFGYAEALAEPLDWDVRPGEFWAVAGSNGCGKTTLFNTVLGFLKPISGSFRRAASCSYVAQVAEDVAAVPARVCDVIGIGLETRRSWFVPFHWYRNRAAIDEVIEAFELEALRKRPFGEISPGERQRVLMAQAMVSRPELVFLDEPSSAMDVVHARAAYRKMARIAAGANISVIAITHHLDIASGAATHVLRFERGRLTQAALGSAPDSDAKNGPASGENETSSAENGVVSGGKD